MELFNILYSSRYKAFFFFPTPYAISRSWVMVLNLNSRESKKGGSSYLNVAEEDFVQEDLDLICATKCLGDSN